MSKPPHPPFSELQVSDTPSAQELFEARNPWAIGSCVDWSKLTPEQRAPWEALAVAPPEPEVPYEQLRFMPPEWM